MNAYRIVGCLIAAVVAPGVSLAADEAGYTRTEDVIYGRKFGTALTLDVFAPKKNANGAGIVLAVSGGWASAHAAINPAWCAELLERGYTVFAVVHGSQPKFTVAEVVVDMHRSVRFIRHHAKDYGINPNRLGITGGSAGGHLSLMIGTAGKVGDPEAKDPVDRASSRVQAVACFFPPTDLLNWREPGRTYQDAFAEELAGFHAPFDFTEFDKKQNRFVLIQDKKRQLEIARDVSPITHVTPDDPPTLVLHGDADKLVWLQQAEIMRDKLNEAGVVNKLIIRKGAGHGWPTMVDDMTVIADWFDKHLAIKSTDKGDGP